MAACCTKAKHESLCFINLRGNFLSLVKGSHCHCDTFVMMMIKLKTKTGNMTAFAQCCASCTQEAACNECSRRSCQGNGNATTTGSRQALDVLGTTSGASAIRWFTEISRKAGENFSRTKFFKIHKEFTAIVTCVFRRIVNTC